METVNILEVTREGNIYSSPVFRHLVVLPGKWNDKRILRLTRPPFMATKHEGTATNKIGEWSRQALPELYSKQSYLISLNPIA